MRQLLRHVYPLALTGCAAATLTLLLWPAPPSASTEPAAADRYTGALLELRNVNPAQGGPLRLAGAEQPETAQPVSEVLPVLVGIAGGQAWLRSPGSGATQRVGRGAALDGWTVVAVGARTVTVRNAQGRNEQLGLFSGGGAASPTALPQASTTTATPALPADRSPPTATPNVP